MNSINPVCPIRRSGQTKWDVSEITNFSITRTGGLKTPILTIPPFLSNPGKRIIWVRTTGSDYRLWPFNEQFYLILNLAIGGDWGGIQGINATIFPLKYYIDYVRVYKWQTNAGPYTLTIEPSAGGTVEVSPQQTGYDAGSEIELTAIPNDGR